MKTIISQIAQKHPNLGLEDFTSAYKAAHPKPDSLNADKYRKAFNDYTALIRKSKRVLKKAPNTTGPDRTPR
jgi:hypothetical protein